ncbi:MAG: DUF4115 domain-containing protein [Paracoccaceae bacterium]|nr:DUF4115 domain-containing protein [Paracoccaceae bacterium]MDE3240608.1 DUF4115 domain-containing protein [Paracoccaceae bacterium]
MIGRRTKPSAAELDKPKGFDDFDLKLGDLMRGERATLGKSLLDVQRELKIKATYIAAIENADLSAFETQGFVAGYVRSYARYLQMDPEWAFQRFCKEAGYSVGDTNVMRPGVVSQQRPVPSLSAHKAKPRTESRDPFADPNPKFLPPSRSFFAGVQPGAVGSLLVLTALVASLGFGAWRVLQVVQRVQVAPVDQAPGAVAALDPLANVARLPGAVPPVEGQKDKINTPSADALSRLYAPQALDVPVLVPRDGPIAAINPNAPSAVDPVTGLPSGAGGTQTASAQTDPNAPVDPALAAAVAAAGGATKDTGAAPVVVADAKPTVQIMAVHPAWVSVKASDGSTLFEKILDAGQKWTVPQGDKPVFLRAGNSGAVYFLVNGKAYGPAGTPGSVTKHLNLSVASLEQTFSVADLGSNPALAKAVAVADASQTLRKK